MYRLENSSAASKTTILLLQAQAIEKWNGIQTKAKHERKKNERKNKKTFETDERGRTKQNVNKLK